MKLRNKKTGEVFGGYSISVNWLGENDHEYHSLTELNEEWEDYKPAGPLIKNASMREVLRLWAKVNLIPSNATTVEYHLAETLTGTETEFWDNNLHIMFYGNIAPNAVHGKIYTIDELCGEEEE